MNSINKRIVKVWKKHYKDNKFEPMFLPPFKKNGILFVGFNPSSDKDDKIRKEMKKKLKLSEDDLKWKPKRRNIDRYVRDKVCVTKKYMKDYPYFAKFKDIAEYIDIKWNHIDLFFHKKTRQKDSKDSKGKIYTTKKHDKSTEFRQDQLDISLEYIKKINPKIIVVANAEASKIIKNSILKEDITPLDKRTGYNTIKINNKKVPIFFTSMLTYGHLDNGSFERLRWHIKKAYERIK